MKGFCHMFLHFLMNGHSKEMQYRLSEGFSEAISNWRRPEMILKTKLFVGSLLVDGDNSITKMHSSPSAVFLRLLIASCFVRW